MSIVRDKIKLTDKLASIHKVEKDGKNYNIGSIELPSFYGSSGNGPKATDDVEELINALIKDKIDGLILDLRRNGGGYLSEAVNLGPDYSYLVSHMQKKHGRQNQKEI